MDKSDMRRGKASVHKKYSNDIALLSGDAMSILATSLISHAPRNHQKIIQTFTRAALDVCEGQQYDMDFEALDYISEDDYLKMISLKTSALLAVSLKIGGLMADAPEHDIDSLYKLGMSMGLGFQLQDDWLDCYGKQEEFGKPIGKDIINKKKTFLWIEAVSIADAQEKKELHNLLHDTEINEQDKIRAVMDVYDKLGIPDRTRNTINACFDEADNYLNKLSVAETKKTIIREFLMHIKNRTY
jgi:geranylgeranyl diphosphate synthase type II